MHAEGQIGPDRRAGAPPAEARRLTPVLARALDLGRGPPGLVSWLARHRPGSSTETLARLADELNQRIRTAGVTETLAE